MVEKVDVVLDNVLGISELFVNRVFAQTCFFFIILAAVSIVQVRISNKREVEL